MSHSNRCAARHESVDYFQSSSGCVLVVMQISGAVTMLYSEALLLMLLG